MTTESMTMVLVALAALTAGLLGAYFQSLFQHRKTLRTSIQKLKFVRYRLILTYMLAVLNPDRGLLELEKLEVEVDNVDEAKEELKVQILIAMLFSTELTIRAMADFSQDPSYEGYAKTARAMRCELY